MGFYRPQLDSAECQKFNDTRSENENTAGFIHEDSYDRDGKGEKSQQRIRQAFIHMQDQLDKFKKSNNPKKMADLRKYCATTIT